MNSEIERAFVAALTPVMAPLLVVPGLTADIDPPDTARLIVDASADNDSPVATLWRLPLIFRLEFPALTETGTPEADLRAAGAVLLTWLQAPVEVSAAFTSDVLTLLPAFHIAAGRLLNEGDRLQSELSVTIGLQEKPPAEPEI